MPKYREWSEEEDALLRQLAAQNKRYAQRLEAMNEAGFTDRTQDAIRNRTWELNQQKGNDWLADQRIGFLDIEATNLKANFGFMLTWCLKLDDGKILYDVVKREEATNPKKFDKRILKSLIEALKQVDVVVTYNGTNYDIPFVRTRCMMQGIKGFPKMGEKKHIDVYFQVKSKMNLHRKSLDSACEAIGIKGKTPIEWSAWRAASVGHPPALRQVLAHNKGDVVILEELFDALQPFARSTRRSM